MPAINPTELSVDELEEQLQNIEDADELDAIFQAEKEGENRKTAKAQIASRKSELNDTKTDGEAEGKEAELDTDEEDTPAIEDVSTNGRFNADETEVFEFDPDTTEDEVHATIEDQLGDDVQDYAVLEVNEGDELYEVVVGYELPTTVNVQEDPEALEDLAGYSISRRVAFAQELIDRTGSPAASTVSYTDDESADPVTEKSGVITFTRAGVETGQDRDHKTQWMHLVASTLGDLADVPMDVQLEVLGDIEYDGITATLGHHFGEHEDDEDEEQEDAEAEEADE